MCWILKLSVRGKSSCFAQNKTKVYIYLKSQCMFLIPDVGFTAQNLNNSRESKKEIQKTKSKFFEDYNYIFNLRYSKL